jgi:membrane protease subunit (stomatin/prohibitin family)
MGIIKAASKAVSDSLADQWLEVFYCPAIPAGMLTVKGVRQTSERSSNTKGGENIITDGSLVIVNDGQCAITAEQGKILDIYDEPGEHKFNSELTKGIFSKGGRLKSIGKQAWERIGYGGEAHISQMILYLSLLEQPGNRFATIVPVRIKSEPLDMDCQVLIGGVYSFKITRPAVFYKNICGNRVRPFTVKEILPQLNAEVVPVVTEAVSEFCESGVRPSEISNYTQELAEIIKRKASEKWAELRGFEIVSAGIDTLRLLEQAEIQRVQYNVMLKDPQMAAATLIGAQSNAMEYAALNPAGAAVGAIGANMFLNNQSSQPTIWYCTCGRMNTTNFCENCGRGRK